MTNHFCYNAKVNKLGYNGIGVGRGFVHWGRRPELPPGMVIVWTY